jgi:hypothetical protein
MSYNTTVNKEEVMEEKLDVFLKTSEIAKKVPVVPQIVVYRDQLSANQLSSVKKSGTYTIEKVPNVYEMEAGGVVLARGKVIRKKDNLFFKVTEVLDIEEKNTENTGEIV